MIGKQLSPILAEIETALWEFEANSGQKTEYTIEGFRAATKIFMSALMDKMWELQENENLAMEDKIKMAESAGNEVRRIVKIFTNIDTRELY